MRKELETALKALGIDARGPIAPQDADRAVAFAWTSRKAKQRAISEAIKAPEPMSKDIEAMMSEGLTLTPEKALILAMNTRSMLAGEFKIRYSVGQHLLDIAFPSVKLGVEVDGMAPHSSPAEFARNIQRMNYLSSCGWTVIRLQASDVAVNSSVIADRIARDVGRLLAEQGKPEPWEK